MAESDTLKRATTMEVTAEEGKKLLEADGTAVEEKEEENKGCLKKTLTMAETVKEAEAIIGNEELGRTRGQDQAPAEDKEEGEEEKPALTKTLTMADTIKDGAGIVESLGDKADAGTRTEAKQIEEAIKVSGKEAQNEHANGETDAAALKRKGTMVTTAEEGEEFLKRQKLSETNGDEATPAKEVEA